ncbi:SET domain-containing protein [Neocallimastix californiae]|jgi:hypothetical protein|uniref:SET domain-containing protein n=1 Tax=Neocallimastix californiae TaxID=1754190 RepID=A0A1Y2ECU0_9FUNG|nr:SET domain-containing protein [Neocallimastix californiae]|eukprot:ORY69403.1 SET domain-containing protein [Neocallimastix californiae]
MEEYLLDNNLSIIESEEKYRSVITNVKIKKGTIIISSPAMGIVLMESARDSYCHNCLSLMQKNKNRCSRCKVAHYCSKECQVNAWKNGHKYTCKLWKEKKLFDNDLMDIDLLVQVVLQISKWNDNSGAEPNKKSSTIFEPGSMTPEKLKDISESDESINWKNKEEKINREAFLSLMTHQDKIEFEEWKYLRDITKAVFLIAPDLESKTSESELIQHLLRFKCNNFVCHDSQLFGIAESAFPVGSLFNHSCSPNATLYYHGNRQIIRAMRDIQQGEEICITYTDVMNSRENRQKLLFEKYKFKCHCERCMDENGLDKKLIPFEEEEIIKDDSILSKKEKEEEERKRKKKEEEDFNKMKGQLKTDAISIHDILDFEKCKALEIDKSSILESYPLLKFIVIVASKLLPVLEFSDEDYSKIHYQLIEDINPLQLNIFTLVCKYTYYCIDANDHLHAAYASLYVLMAYLVFLGRYHPLTGLQWLTFGKLVWNIGDDYKKEALYSLHQAKNSIMISEGRSDVLEEIENLIKQFS